MASTETKPPRAVGHVQYIAGKPGELGHYRVRLRLQDGTRPYVHLDPSPRSPAAERRARQKAEAWMERLREQSLVLAAQPPAAPEKETVAEWFDRYLEHREAKGHQSVRDARGRIANWVLPAIGTRPIAAVTADELEQIVAILDQAIAEDRISWKTAANVWGEVKAALNQACRSKRRELRVRSDNPAVNVPGPDRGQEPKQPILYPDEVLKLLACEGVPAHWRVLYAFAVYTGARAGELAALSAEDIDLEHRRITISRQKDRLTGELRMTKTKITRAFDIEPALVPLVEKLVAARPTGPILRLPVDEHRAALLREHLSRAGVTRAELFVTNDRSRMPFTFHGMRHTHLTWMAVRGDDGVKIQMRAGHTDFRTTQRYVEAARTLGGGFGVPFPGLPAGLLRAAVQDRARRALTAKEAAELRGLAQGGGAAVAVPALREALAARTGKRVGLSTIWREVRAGG